MLFDEEGNVFAKHAGYNPGDEVKLEKEIIEMISKSSLKDSLAIPANIDPRTHKIRNIIKIITIHKQR